ncbi:MAG: hypothetical protein LBM09_00645 [Candidatus Nomurabacteria bacterium]|jgi:cell division protein FtsL|nr:hypothetical protein [Candidatus Nomurabacteria bacterium]
MTTVKTTKNTDKNSKNDWKSRYEKYDFRKSAFVATIIAVIFLGISIFQFAKICDLNSRITQLESENSRLSTEIDDQL